MDHGHRHVGPLLAELRPPALDVVLVEEIRDLGLDPLGCIIAAATTRSGARLMRLWIIGPPMQKPKTRNLRMPRWSISPSWSSV
jgi:hypothetical protein